MRTAKLELGVDRFVFAAEDAAADSRSDLIGALLEEVEAAEVYGLDAFGIGEHHSAGFLDSSPAVLLGAAAARTRQIRLSSAVTVLGAADPVRVFQDFASVDLISNGRAEIIAGRGSSAEAFALFGLDMRDYDSLFAEKLDLLLSIRSQADVRWSGRHRPPLLGHGVYPRPVQASLPIWVGATGTPASFVRAGTLGLPLALGTIGGEFARLRPLVDLYREAGRRAGHPPSSLRVAIHAIGYVGEDDTGARNAFFPPYAHIFGALGKRLGWPELTRDRFEALVGPEAALVVGGPDEVARKIAYIDQVLGGISRICLQMSVGPLARRERLRALELLGHAVADRLAARPLPMALDSGS